MLQTERSGSNPGLPRLYSSAASDVYKGQGQYVCTDRATMTLHSTQNVLQGPCIIGISGVQYASGAGHYWFNCSRGGPDLVGRRGWKHNGNAQFCTGCAQMLQTERSESNPELPGGPGY